VHLDGNKQELLHLLAKFILSQPTADKVVICTFDDMVEMAMEKIPTSKQSVVTAEPNDCKIDGSCSIA